MNTQFKRILTIVIAITLAFSLFSPITVSAASSETVQPYASNYLTSYNTYIYRVGTDGEIHIWFDVMGTGDMDEIGVLSIELYEVSSTGQETWIKTFLHEDHASMLATDDWYHASYVSYQGSTTKNYKAYVCIWAGKNGSGDTRYMWATMV